MTTSLSFIEQWQEENHKEECHKKSHFESFFTNNVENEANIQKKVHRWDRN